jgi:hypothetical protein
LKKTIGTSGPNTSVIAPGETPPLPGKKAVEKPSAISKQQEKKLAENKISTPPTAGKKSLEKPSAITKLQEEKLSKNKSSTPPTACKKALKKPSSAMSKQQEIKIIKNKTSKMPTRNRFERNTKKNPWAMTKPNYKFVKSILSDDDLNEAAPCIRDLYTFYMQRVKSDDDSPIMLAFRPGTSAWPKREESSNGLEQILVYLSDLYDLFNLDAFHLTLLRCLFL